MELRTGHTIKGYELRERIGEGGFGAVYRAVQSAVGREVAVKIILPERANRPDFIRRFQTEAELIARLEHHYIVPLYDYWRDPQGAYLVMRWLRGGSLYDLLKSQGALSIEEVVQIMDQITQALHTAHRNQVIHRDIKPGNILLDEDGNAFLADFGIAKDYATATSNTDVDHVMGSPDYLAPEQARGEPVTPQTDIYSLGVVLYEMLEGHHPFPNMSPVERLFKHINEPLPDLDQVDENVRANVNAVIQKATCKDPTKRFRDVVEMSQALQEAAAMGGGQASPSMVELLTPREQEVLQLIIDGKSNREIAEKLVLTVTTVKTYIRRIYRKLNVRSRVQAIVKARELDLIVKSGQSDSRVSLSRLPEPDNPYKGLRAFQAADEQRFFGREALTSKLLKRLQEDVQLKRFLTIVGPSGSGKSSVVKAGLIPALWRGALSGSDNWYIVEMLPGQHPLDELEVALLRVAADHSLNLHEQLERDSRGLLRATNLILSNDESELLLVIDQFEEVFTLVENEAERQHFLDLLYQAAIDERSRVRIVVTLRADYYDRPLHYPQFGRMIPNRVETVLPMSADELEKAIREPCANLGVRFEDGLVSRIVSDAHYQPGALPLLQYALTELFERRDERTLTFTAYEELGGTGGALAKRADEIYLEHDEAGKELVRQLFLRLVTLGEGAEDTRRRIQRAELLDLTPDDDLMDDIIETYTDSRLLSSDHDPSSRQPTIELAHEAIIREWDRLRQWLNDSRDDIRQARQLEQAAEAWKASGGDASYLLRGTRLEQVEQWMAISNLVLTPLENTYIQQSLQQRQAEAEAEQERQAREAAQAEREQAITRQSLRRLRALVAVFVAAALLSGGFGVFALFQRDEAVSAQQVAQNLALASAADAALARGDTYSAVALAYQANTVDTPTALAQSALFNAATAPGYTRYWDTGLSFTSFTVSPDGTWGFIGSMSAAENAMFWQLDTDERLKVKAPPFFRGAVMLPDSQSVIALFKPWDSETATLIQWGRDGQEITSWTIDDLGITEPALYLSESGELDILGYERVDILPNLSLRTVRFRAVSVDWEQQRVNSRASTEPVENLAWWGDVILAPGGETFIAVLPIANADATDVHSILVEYNIRTGAEVRQFDQQIHHALGALALSPDKTMVLAGTGSGKVVDGAFEESLTLWDYQSGSLMRVLSHNPDYYHTPWSINFNEAGTRIVSGTFAGDIVVTDVATGAIIDQTTASGQIYTAGFIPNKNQYYVTLRSGQTFVREYASYLTRESTLEEIWPRVAHCIGDEYDPRADVVLCFEADGVTGHYIRRTGDQFELLSTVHFVNPPPTPDYAQEPIRTLVIADSEPQAIYTVNKDLQLLKLDPYTGAVEATIATYKEPIFLGYVSPEKNYLAVIKRTPMDTFQESTIRVAMLDLETGQETSEFSFENKDPNAMGTNIPAAYSADGRYVVMPVALGRWQVAIADLETGKMVSQIEGSSADIYAANISRDDTRVATVSDDGIARIWDVNTAQEIGRIQLPGERFFFVKFLYDDRYLFLHGSKAVYYVDAGTGEIVRTIDISDVDDEADWFMINDEGLSSPMGTHNLFVDPLLGEGELVQWAKAHRDIRDLNCYERRLYQVEPLCDDSVTQG